MSAVRELETAREAKTGRRHAVATGRGATAIWLALEALAARHPDRRRVVLLATLCLSPPSVTALAGLEAVFCDVEPQTGQLDPRALAALLNSGETALCVIAAHLYGEPCRIEEIADLCRQAGTALIEDAAQAWGASIGERPAGSFGDLSVVSFGHTKILDAGGGGAVLSDDDALAEDLAARARALPEKPAEAARWGADYRSRYYALAADFAVRPEARREAGALCLAHPGLYRYRLEEEQARRILDALPGTPAALAHRRAMAGLYEQSLDPAIPRLARQSGGVPWRFSILLEPHQREPLLAGLREAGFDASAWYPCAAAFFTDAAPESLPGSRQIETRIVNLWTDTTTDAEKVRQASTFINEALAQLASSRVRKVAR